MLRRLSLQDQICPLVSFKHVLRVLLHLLLLLLLLLHLMLLQ
jgi:hypothetical protein